MRSQKTIKNDIAIKGVGLHTGKPVELKLKPAPPNTGIVFKRTDVSGSKGICAYVPNVVMPEHGGGRQTLLVEGDAKVQTVEHLMATLCAFEVDNVLIEVNGSELPALDGSALLYAEEIRKSGIQDQKVPQEIFKIKEPVYLENGSTSTVVLPSSDLRISYTLSYNNPALSDQYVTFVINKDTFLNELASARTFCLKEEAEALLSQGFGKGANPQNTLVFENNLPIENKLRFPDEAARHKVVDLIGDLYLLGCPLKGHIITNRTGHKQNFELVKKLYSLKEKTNNKENLRKQSGPIIEGRTLNINQIMEIMPHRYPFLFVDRVLDIEPGKKAIAIKNISFNEKIFLGHFPGHPIFPGVLIIEALAQVGGIVTMNRAENRGKLAYFMSIDKAKFRAPVFPGDQMRMEVEVIKSKGKIGICAGKAYVGDKLVCEAEVKFAIMDR